MDDQSGAGPHSTRHAAAAGAVGRWCRALAVAAVVLATATQASAEPPAVVATIKPVHALVAAIMDGVGKPDVLISGNASPHTFALKPSEARALARADIVFRVSPVLEPFTIRLVQSLPRRTRVVSLADAPGMVHLPKRAGEAFETHDHDHHAHGRDDRHGSAVDPHVWLDPENARAMAREIVATLSALAPADAARFAENGRRLDASLAALGKEIGDRLALVDNRPVIVFHDAYQYFEHRYGLKVVGSITINPEVAPSAKRLTELRRRVAHDGAACILSEPQFSPRIIEAVIEGSTARAGILDPVGGAIEAGPRHYHQTMRGIADALARCLAGR